MRWVTNLLKRLWGAYFYLVFCAIFLLLYPGFWILLRSERTFPAANFLRKVWAFFLLILTGVPPRYYFAGEVEPDKTYIFCANHSSILDIPLYVLFIKSNKFRFMAKKQFGDYPLFGNFFRTVDIGVDRESKLDSFRAYQKAADSLAQGYHMIMFPEGRSSLKAPEMLPFKNGPFKLAIETGTPIVPVTFIDNWHLFKYHTLAAKPGLARVVVHEPIDTKHWDISEVDRLKEQVYEIIDEPLKKNYESRFAVG